MFVHYRPTNLTVKLPNRVVRLYGTKFGRQLQNHATNFVKFTITC